MQSHKRFQQEFHCNNCHQACCMTDPTVTNLSVQSPNQTMQARGASCLSSVSAGGRAAVTRSRRARINFSASVLLFTRLGAGKVATVSFTILCAFFKAIYVATVSFNRAAEPGQQAGLQNEIELGTTMSRSRARPGPGPSINFVKLWAMANFGNYLLLTNYAGLSCYSYRHTVPLCSYCY